MSVLGSVRRACAVLALVPLAGCAVAGHTSSPWEWGGTLRPAPGLWTLSGGDATVHPMVGYTYLSFDGGSDQLFEIGPQIRFPIGETNRPLWVGGEATFSHLRTSVDGVDGTFTNNGWSITGLVGMPFGDSRWGPNVFGGAGISNYGADGWNVRFGIDLQPTFLWSN